MHNIDLIAITKVSQAFFKSVCVLLRRQMTYIICNHQYNNEKTNDLHNH